MKLIKYALTACLVVSLAFVGPASAAKLFLRWEVDAQVNHQGMAIRGMLSNYAPVVAAMIAGKFPMTVNEVRRMINPQFPPHPDTAYDTPEWGNNPGNVANRGEKMIYEEDVELEEDLVIPEWYKAAHPEVPEWAP